ncbi:MAG: hypothetical protein M0019_10875 [Actinomycetota bacterium]|nr:hypothetical protein [Actinomycetota bacterium]
MRHHRLVITSSLAAALLSACGTSTTALPSPNSSVAPNSSIASNSTISSNSAAADSSTTTTQESTTALAQSGANFKWVLASNVLQDLKGYPSLFAKVSAAGVLEITPSTSNPITGPSIIPAVKFTSAAALEAAVNGKLVPTWARAVVYDPEHWSFTPLNEQINPGAASQAASKVAKGAGYIYVVTPALDLSKAIAPNEPISAQLLEEAGVFSQLAVGADAMVIQSQSLQSDISAFDSLLSTASAEAKQSNPNIMVLGGLSTNGRGVTPTSESLLSAYESAKNAVQGYWFNVPGQNQYCPNCPASNQSLAISFFSLIP